jgi:hypothetical protein
MDGTGSWRGRIGAALSLSALGVAIALLFGPGGRACSTPQVPAQLDVTPLLLLAIAAAAIVFDVRAFRKGDRFWAPIGLVAVSLAAVLGMWDAPSVLFPAGCG